MAVSAVLLAGCVNKDFAPVEAVAAARVATQDAPFVALVSMVNERSDGSEHSALLINGSQQVIYDPAGTFEHSKLPRRDDVIYGVTPDYADYYNSYHARFGFYVEVQKLEISLEMADALIARAQAEGAVPKLTCAIATSNILNDFEPFAQINTTIFPGRVRKLFSRIDGVETTIIREDDIGQNYR